MNDSETNTENISSAKKQKFGSATSMLGIFYTLKENIPPREICPKINAQTDEETIMELKRAGIEVRR